MFLLTEPLQLGAAMLIFVHIIDIALGRRMVSVELDLATYPGSERDCIGGNIGLTNTSILVQYRLLDAAAADPRRWAFLAEVSIGDENMLQSQNIALPPIDVSAEGMQFRFLQLEHGGRGCNCWEIRKFRVTFRNVPNSISTVSLVALTNINKFECFSHGRQNSRKPVFCYGNGNEARGVTTKALYFGRDDGAECPGNSGSELIPPKGPAIPGNCASSSASPRL